MASPAGQRGAEDAHSVFEKLRWSLHEVLDALRSDSEAPRVELVFAFFLRQRRGRGSVPDRHHTARRIGGDGLEALTLADCVTMGGPSDDRRIQDVVDAPARARVAQFPL